MDGYIHERSRELTALQPAEFANGVLVRRAVRLSEDHAMTEFALQADLTLDQLVEELYLRIYTRRPTAHERRVVQQVLAGGFATRRRPDASKAMRSPDHRGMVSWSNHLEQEASTIKLKLQEVVRRGDPPTDRLDPDWRERLEDVLWSMLNSPEFRWAP